MPKKSINSTLDVIGWFCHKAVQDKLKLSSCQLQNLLFLAQMHHLNKHNRVLVPTMFVCYKQGFYEPTTNAIIAYKLPLLKVPAFADETSLLLESVWQKYSPLSEQELLSFVTSLNCWLNSYHQDEETIVNPFDIAMDFIASISRGKIMSSNKPKIRLSQNGPVQVSPWHPRKISNSSTSRKKENNNA